MIIIVNTDNNIVKLQENLKNKNGQFTTEKLYKHINPDEDISGLEDKFPNEFEKITKCCEAAKIGYVKPAVEL